MKSRTQDLNLEKVSYKQQKNCTNPHKNLGCKGGKMSYIPEELIQTTHQLPLDGHLPWPIWKTFNRLKAGVARTKANMVTWGFNGEDDTCDCGDDRPMNTSCRAP